MDLHAFDNPELLSTLFYPRAADPNPTRDGRIIDGTLAVEKDVVIGYRLFKVPESRAVIILYHGNGEIATDYNMIAPLYHEFQLSLMVVDFRGYGWSTGQPTVSSLIADVDPLHNALAEIMTASFPDNPFLLVMGRSLGSVPAIHMAYAYPDTFKGLIIESGFATPDPLLVRRGFSPDFYGGGADPIGNERKMTTLSLPLLVIHGEQDQLIPVAQGQALFDASPVASKRILRVPGAGHNNLLVYADRYFAAVDTFVTSLDA
jgi:hypothetical protein